MVLQSALKSSTCTDAGFMAITRPCGAFAGPETSISLRGRWGASSRYFGPKTIEQDPNNAVGDRVSLVSNRHACRGHGGKLHALQTIALIEMRDYLHVPAALWPGVDKVH
jgi:hypothetical protein